MLDLIAIVSSAAMFWLAIAYIHGCERLNGGRR
jgi:hypothetical protein